MVVMTFIMLFSDISLQELLTSEISYFNGLNLLSGVSILLPLHASWREAGRQLTIYLTSV